MPSDRSIGTDVYGNTTSYFHVTAGHTKLVVTGESVVEVDIPDAAAVSATGKPWEDARPSTANGPLAVEFTLDLQPPEITPEVTAYAAESFTPGRSLLDAVTELNTRIFADFTYRSGSTTVSTRVADVFAARGRLPGLRQDRRRLPALARAGLALYLRLPGNRPAAG